MHLNDVDVLQLQPRPVEHVRDGHRRGNGRNALQGMLLALTLPLPGDWPGKGGQLWGPSLQFSDLGQLLS